MQLDYPIHVLNKYTLTLEQQVLGVDIGRGSLFGNPFKMENKSDEERNRVCHEYEMYLFKAMGTPDCELMQALDILYKKWRRDGYLYLVCYCAPKDCHGDIIARYLKWYHSQQVIGGDKF